MGKTIAITEARRIALAVLAEAKVELAEERLAEVLASMIEPPEVKPDPAAEAEWFEEWLGKKKNEIGFIPISVRPERHVEVLLRSLHADMLARAKGEG